MGIPLISNSNATPILTNNQPSQTSEDQKLSSVDHFEDLQTDLNQYDFLNTEWEEIFTKKGMTLTHLNLSYCPTTKIIPILRLCPNLAKISLLYPEKQMKFLPNITKIVESFMGKNLLNLGNQPDAILGMIFGYLKPIELAKIACLRKIFFKISDQEKVKWMNSDSSFRNVVHNRNNLTKLIERNSRKIKSLNMEGAYVEDFLNQIVACQTLTTLSLRNCKIQLSFLEQLVQKISPSLLKLDLGASRPKYHDKAFHLCNYIGKGIKILVNSPLKNLTYLDLGYNDLADVGLEEIAKSTNFTQLKTLILTANRISYFGLKFLCNSTTLTSLTKIDFSQNPINNKGFSYFVSQDLSRKIQTINFRGTDIEFYQGTEIESICMAHLTSLNLSNNHLNNPFIQSLIYSPINTTIVELNLNHTDIGFLYPSIFPKTIETISQPGSFPNLRILSLSSNDLGDTGVTILTSSPMFSRWNNLDLSYNKISNVGALALASSINKSCELKTLNLSGNKITSIGIAALMLGIEFKNVLSLSLYNNHFEITSPTKGGGIILENKSNHIN